MDQNCKKNVKKNKVNCQVFGFGFLFIIQANICETSATVKLCETTTQPQSEHVGRISLSIKCCGLHTDTLLLQLNSLNYFIEVCK